MNKERIIFHIDVNNAFLSWTAVKLLKEGYKTDIRNVSSVIGGDEARRCGIVLAKSPVAKSMGIKTAETLYSARKKSKDLLIFPPSFEFYRQRSNELFEYLSKYTPLIEIFSIDECFLDFTNTKYMYTDYLKLAYKIKDDILRKFGYTVNIGIANNKLCAKMASDFEKPNRVHTLYLNEIKRKMWPLDVSDLFMIGKSTTEKLKTMGINTIGDLAVYNRENLTQKFKKQAFLMSDYANGIDMSEVLTVKDKNKNISTSKTFEKDIVDKDTLENTIFNQTQFVCSELRKQKLYALTVGINIKTYDFKSYSRQSKLNSASSSTKYIYNEINSLFNKEWDGSKVRSIGVKVSNLISNRKDQISFFETESDNDKIDYIVDFMHDKFGISAINVASSIKKD